MSVERQTYIPDAGPHQGHVVTVVGEKLPSVRFDEVRGQWDTYVRCECGEAWAFVPAEADELAEEPQP